MLILGVFFIFSGLYFVFNDIYDIKSTLIIKEIVKKKDFSRTLYYEFKASLGLLSVVLGCFSLLNYFIF